eukprot:CAMPEP_0119015318 /NCGR_PEP_ID=MMETSP1176-20130426/10808_1 /TAXON_ID=265551 /ORGANISM="Synedropsis recta cf, Strain CCMP1620" /LENGTH=454 /DNA_ID=CAMNT_0006968601 /DNA_START=22 /DNA_END=1386 /DNA_ORIENTATION=-
MARLSVVIACLVVFAINLTLFVYIPIVQRTAQLHAQNLANASPNAHIAGSFSQQQQQQEKRQEQEQQEQQIGQREEKVAEVPPGNEAEVDINPEDEPKLEKDSDVFEGPFTPESFIARTSLAKTVYDGPKTQRNQAEDMNKTKIVGFITGTYGKIGMRWYDRLQTLGYNNHYIVCTDEETFANFQTNFPEYRVELSVLPPFPPKFINLRYGKKMRHQVKMLFAHRWVYMLDQLKQGNHILVTDVDNIFSSYHSTEELERSEFDVFHALETKHPVDVYDLQGFVFCGGMGWFRASKPTIRFIEEVVHRCGIECDDQVLLNRIIAYVLHMEWHRSGDEHDTVTTQTKDTAKKVKVFGSHFKRIEGLITNGFTGYSNSTGVKVSVWDRDFAYRGKNDPSECPANNWVSMPFVVFVSRWQAPSSKLGSYDLWDKTCPNPYTKLIGGKEKKIYKAIDFR